jgi:RNA polymerase sigma-70 factor (ECF subfamily)
VGDARRVTTGNAADASLLYAVARGDREALSQLYTRHAGVMFSLALRLLHDPHDAEDLVHDAFVEAWQHAGEYDPARASVRTWLLIRVRSRGLDRARQRLARRARLETLAASPPEERDAHEIDHGRVREALSSLNEDQRGVLELGYFRGLSSAQIATALGIPVGTVKSRVSAALAQLRRALGAAKGDTAP